LYQALHHSCKAAKEDNKSDFLDEKATCHESKQYHKTHQIHVLKVKILYDALNAIYQ
jgi:hypothetical protein